MSTYYCNGGATGGIVCVIDDVGKVWLNKQGTANVALAGWSKLSHLTKFTGISDTAWTTAAGCKEH